MIYRTQVSFKERFTYISFDYETKNDIHFNSHDGNR